MEWLGKLRAKWTSLKIQAYILRNVGRWMSEHYNVPNWRSITLGQGFDSLCGLGFTITDEHEAKKETE